MKHPEKYAVVGNPIAHSKSPEIHALFAQQTRQAMTYERLEAPLDGFEEFAFALRDGGRVWWGVTARRNARCREDVVKAASHLFTVQQQPPAVAIGQGQGNLVPTPLRLANRAWCNAVVAMPTAFESLSDFACVIHLKAPGAHGPPVHWTRAAPRTCQSEISESAASISASFQ